jgi:trans-aconitate methyltransferase
MTKVFQKFDTGSGASELLKLRCDTQSLSNNFTLLDIGARTGAGTALLRAVHHPASFARMKLHQVTALDLDASALEVARSEYPDLEFIAEDMRLFYNIRKWDIVLSSHTIEHTTDPDEFLEGMIKLASQYVIIACPFAEDNPCVGHVSRFDMQFFDRHKFDVVEIYRSQHWHGSMACIAMLRVGSAQV